MDEFKQKLELTLNRLYKENKLSIDTYSELMEFADPNQNLQLQQTGVSSSFKTKEYPEGSEIVINKINVNYSQVNEEKTDTDDNLKLSICHQGVGFYFVLESKRWAFNNIDELVKILYDFQSKSKVE